MTLKPDKTAPIPSTGGRRGTGGRARDITQLFEVFRNRRAGPQASCASRDSRWRHVGLARETCADFGPFERHHQCPRPDGETFCGIDDTSNSPAHGIERGSGIGACKCIGSIAECLFVLRTRRYRPDSQKGKGAVCHEPCLISDSPESGRIAVAACRSRQLPSASWCAPSPHRARRPRCADLELLCDRPAALRTPFSSPTRGDPVPGSQTAGEVASVSSALVRAVATQGTRRPASASLDSTLSCGTSSTRRREFMHFARSPPFKMRGNDSARVIVSRAGPSRGAP